jgi:uncharacterized cupin superfamily protein
VTTAASWELLPRLTTRGVAAVELDDWGVPDEESTGYRIVSGSPAVRGRVLWVATDRRSASGLWECSPGTVGGTFLFNEVDVFLAGRMTVHEANGASFDVTVGDHAMWPEGWSGDWEIHETVRKAFVMWAREPLPLPLPG